jgi:hypothetical protein
MSYGDDKEKVWVMKQFDNFFSQFSWASEISVPIITALHGTDNAIAGKQ